MVNEPSPRFLFVSLGISGFYLFLCGKYYKTKEI